MKNFLKKLLWILLALTLSLTSSAADYDKMRTNIRVQEKIIDTMFESTDDFTLLHGAEGIYIPGFGVVISFRVSDSKESMDHNLRDIYFNVPGCEYRTFDEAIDLYDQSLLLGLEEPLEPDEILEGEEIIISEEKKKVKGDIVKIREELKKHTREMTEKSEELRKIREKIAKEREAKQEELCNEFRGKADKLIKLLRQYIIDYGPAISIPSGERVMLRGEFETFLPLDLRNYNFEMTASGTDLDKLKNGRLSSAKFEDNITVKELKDEKDLPADVKIMNNILKTAFEKKTASRYVLWTESFGEGSWSSYMEGFGALFFHNYSFGHSILLNTIGVGPLSNEINIVLNGDTVDGSKEDWNKRIDKTEAELSELLKIYIPTLKSVKPSESVIVAVKFGGSYDSKKPSMLIIKVKKDDITNTKNRDKIKLTSWRL